MTHLLPELRFSLRSQHIKLRDVFANQLILALLFILDVRGEGEEMIFI